MREKKKIFTTTRVNGRRYTTTYVNNKDVRTIGGQIINEEENDFEMDAIPAGIIEAYTKKCGMILEGEEPWDDYWVCSKCFQLYEPGELEFGYRDNGEPVTPCCKSEYFSLHNMYYAQSDRYPDDD